MENKGAPGICSLSIHYLSRRTLPWKLGSPSSTGLFSHREDSGLREDAPAASTCQLVHRHVRTQTAGLRLCSHTHTHAAHVRVLQIHIYTDKLQCLHSEM